MKKIDLDPLNRKLTHFHAAPVDERWVVLSGGFDLGRRSVTNEVHLQDVETGGWCQLPSMFVPRCEHGGIALGTKLYIVLGSTDYSLEAIDLENFDNHKARPKWQLFDIDGFKTRTNPVVMKMNAS